MEYPYLFVILTIVFIIVAKSDLLSQSKPTFEVLTKHCKELYEP